MKRVMIGVPSGEHVHADFAMSLCGIYAQKIEGVSLGLINAKGCLITVNRNNIIHESLRVGADYVLFLDADMVLPPTALAQLLKWDKKIVGASYRKRKHPYDLLGEVFDKESQDLQGDLVKMARMPFGCMLIATEVFKAPSYVMPWFRETYRDGSHKINGEDYHFCDKAHEAGFEIFCDVELTKAIGHLGNNVVVYDDIRSI